MLPEKILHRIEQTPILLQKPVRLVLFLSDMGCPSCPDMAVLCHAIKLHSRKMALETYDVVMDRDKSELYGVRRAPTLVVQGGEGHCVAFSGIISERTLEVLFKTITSLSSSTPWFPEQVNRALHHLADNISIRVFAGGNSSEDTAAIDTAVGTAITSRLVSVEIINAAAFPDLVNQYGIRSVPTTLFGEQLRIEGQVPVSEFLEMIFRTQGAKPGPERKCLVCGSLSDDTICMNCKNRIQAEALEHKLKSEKSHHTETP